MKQLLVLILLLAGAGPMAAQGLPQSRIEALEKTYKMALFRGVDGDLFDMESDPAARGAQAYTNILGWLPGRVAGLQVYYYRGIPYPYIRGYLANLYLDELRVDAATINSIPVSDIALVKVMKGPVVIAGGSPGGTIAIYTKRGEGE
ncbi:hypothetical protein EPD60_12325 [Flaviaesturariibacter flavus]|uniref:TonB-dependent receptor plug domain-containing protein n=1 Tax=Flaviaesturariibacter flavus TaxID=2502780 RepID=A0A4R1B9K1_9BACT|nr:hypothetical protein [Flaviaesturariibacter flavus]TCJ13577.1 hypothetical protein EPD60_12325 [Flaviaesturariibacter flavus]